jgi:hypothetical protein
VANIVQDRRCDHSIPTGMHVLTVSAVPSVELRQPTSITVNVRPSGTYIFTALWDSDQVYLRPTTLSPAEMAKPGLQEALFNFPQDPFHLFPAEGAQGLALYVTERAHLENECAHRLVIRRF